MNWRRLTIIVIPETGRKTRKLQLPQIAIVATGTILIGLVLLAVTAFYNNVNLVQRIHELEPLQVVTRHQRTEIEEIVAKATLMQEQLDHLHAVEANIRQITAANAELLTPQSRTILDGKVTTELTGRGGGRTVSELEQRNTGAILSSFIPDEISQMLFSPKIVAEKSLDQTPLKLTDPTQAKEINARMALQIQAGEDLAWRLSEHEKTVESYVEHLVNRPIGLPVTGGRLTDRFGSRNSPFGWGQQLHTGLDIAAPYWTDVTATAPGTVVQAGWKGGGFGYTVTIDHTFGYQTMYAHLVDWDVKADERVERGQLIGWVGSTGASTGPHLHYEVHIDGDPVDPVKYLN